MTNWVDAGSVAPTSPDEVRVVPFDAKPLAVAHVDGRWYAFDDDCPHHDCPLADGYLEQATIECSCHGSVFDVTTGALLRGPALNSIAVYPTREEDGRLFVQTDS